MWHAYCTPFPQKGHCSITTISIRISTGENWPCLAVTQITPKGCGHFQLQHLKYSEFIYQDKGRVKFMSIYKMHWLHCLLILFLETKTGPYILKGLYIPRHRFTSTVNRVSKHRCGCTECGGTTYFHTHSLIRLSELLHHPSWHWKDFMKLFFSEKPIFRS